MLDSHALSNLYNAHPIRLKFASEILNCAARADLDAAVLAAYSFSPKNHLLALNRQVAAGIEANQPVTAPGVPPSHGTGVSLISADCIEP